MVWVPSRGPIVTTTRSPTWAARVDWSHPLVARLAGAFVSWRGTMMDATGYTIPTRDASSGHVTREGSSPLFGGGNSNDRIDLGSIATTHPLSLNNNPGAPGEMSFAFRCRLDSGGNNNFQRIIDKSNGGNGAGGYVVFMDDRTGDKELKLGVDGSTFSTPTGVLINGEWATWVVTRISSSTGLDVWKDGLQVASGVPAAKTVPTITTNAAIGNWNHSTDRMFNGPIEFVWVWDRKLTNVEALAISADPYQLLEPVQPRIWVSVTASGANTATGTLTAAAATASGTAGITITATGSVDSGAASADGAAGLTLTATGSVASGASAISGTASHGNGGTGTLQAGAAAVSGAAALALDASGTPAAGAAAAAGTAKLTLDASGTPAAGAATISGAAQNGDINTASGTLTAGAGGAAGTAKITYSATGALAAGAGAASGAANLEHKGSGAIQCGAAIINGTAVITIDAAGALAAGLATVSGVDSVSRHPQRIYHIEAEDRVHSIH